MLCIDREPVGGRSENDLEEGRLLRRPVMRAKRSDPLSAIRRRLASLLLLVAMPPTLRTRINTYVSLLYTYSVPFVSVFQYALSFPISLVFSPFYDLNKFYVITLLAYIFLKGFF